MKMTKIPQKTGRKRIGIDARFYGPLLSKGLGRYVQEIVDNVIALDQENEYVIFLNKENYSEFITDNPRVRKVAVNIKWYTALEQILFPLIIVKERLDLMHFPHFNVPVFTPGRFVVTIHDLILTKFPTVRASTLSPVFYYIKNFLYRLVIKIAVMRASKVIAVSEFTKKDVVEQFKISPAKVQVTLEGVADLASNKDRHPIPKSDDKETLLGYNIRGDFILYVGNAYPHKNLDFLIEVFSKMLENKPDFRLVLVGKEDYFYKHLKESARKRNLWKEGDDKSPIVFPGYVPDSELKVLYGNAQAYVFPSLYEGFGLPPLEAMSMGCPVISSDQSSLPEILGEAALYFNPRDQEDVLKKIETIIKNDNLRNKLVERGYKQIKKYNWQEAASKTLKIYNNILDNPK